MLAPHLADNGGRGETRLPLPGSPVLDRIPAGVCDFTPFGHDLEGEQHLGQFGIDPIAPVTSDQRGVARPLGEGCDVGSVEGTLVSPPAPVAPTEPGAPDPEVGPSPRHEPPARRDIELIGTRSAPRRLAPGAYACGAWKRSTQPGTTCGHHRTPDRDHGEDREALPPLQPLPHAGSGERIRRPRSRVSASTTTRGTEPGSTAGPRSPSTPIDAIPTTPSSSSTTETPVGALRPSPGRLRTRGRRTLPNAKVRAGPSRLSVIRALERRLMDLDRREGR